MEKQLHVLLIDDSKASNAFNKALLEGMNICKEIKTCSSGKEALLYLKTITNDGVLPDLIFVDLVMPKMSGFSFVEKYLDMEEVQSSKKKRPVLVVLSDYAEKSNFNKGRSFTSYGIVELFKKPLDIENVKYIQKKYFEENKDKIL